MEDELKLEIKDDGTVSISGKTTAKNFKAQMEQLKEMGLFKLNSKAKPEQKFDSIITEMPMGTDGFDKFIRVSDLQDFIEERIRANNSTFDQLRILHEMLCYRKVK